MLKNERSEHYLIFWTQIKHFHDDGSDFMTSLYILGLSSIFNFFPDRRTLKNSFSEM